MARPPRREREAATPRRQGLRPLKRLGQHLLIDPNMIDGILTEAAIRADDAVLEIGPGTGALSSGLARAKRLVVVELDPRYAAHLRDTFADRPHVTVLHRDVLTLTPAEIGELLQAKPPPASRKVVANIPYYITGPILSLLLNEGAFLQQPLSPEVRLFDSILLMVQKELGERLMAHPGTRAWGALTVKVQYAAHVEHVLDVSRRSFRPQPRVDSMVVRLWPRLCPPVAVPNPSLYWRVVEAIFRTRRKTLRNSLRQAGLPVPTDLDAHVRGETLGLEELAALTERIGESMGGR